VLASALGWPVLNVPVGFTDSHGDIPVLPIGLDLLGRPFSEPTLFAIGRACELSSVQWGEPTLPAYGP